MLVDLSSILEWSCIIFYFYFVPSFQTNNKRVEVSWFLICCRWIYKRCCDQLIEHYRSFFHILNLRWCLYFRNFNEFYKNTHEISIFWNHWWYMYSLSRGIPTLACGLGLKLLVVPSHKCLQQKFNSWRGKSFIDGKNRTFQEIYKCIISPFMPKN